MTENDTLELIYTAVDEVNEFLLPEAQLSKSPGTIILGDGGALDSLGVVNLLVAIEEKMTASGSEFVSPLGLIAEEDAFEKLRTIESLKMAIVAGSTQQ